MSLRSKIVLILVTVVVAYASSETLSSRYFFERLIAEQEQAQLREVLGRVRDRIEGELDLIASKGRILAGTNGMARYVAGDYPDYERDNLGLDALERAEVDLFYVCDAGGRVLWGSVLDPDTHAPLRLREFPRGALAANHPALRFGPGAQSVTGVSMTDAHPLFFATLPVHGPADGALLVEDAPNKCWRAVHGTLVLGRFLGADLRQRIVGEELALAGDKGSAARRHIELLEHGDPSLPPEMKHSEGGQLYLEGEDGLLHAYDRIVDKRTDLPLALHVAVERSQGAFRAQLRRYQLVTTLIGGSLILLVLVRLLERYVVSPLTTLTSKAVEIGRRDDTTIRVGLERTDEIGQLSGEFDKMLGKLARSREQVVQTARMAGMSEIASGVLHNVGNVLNSVNVAANLATRRTDELSVGDLEMLVGVLKANEQGLAEFVRSDPRGKHLVPFLGELSGALGAQRRAIQDELRTLGEGIEHIAELVRAQQSYAGTKGVFEHARLDQEVEAAMRICRQNLAFNAELEVEREFEELPAVRVDKHKLMEILVNLIQNAGQALAERGGPDQRLTLRIARAGDDKARIEVRDNGVGIAREDLTRVFHHGFTTKKDGHGFGLHVSANAATEMGAKLSAASAGRGAGAAFFLDIPMQEEAALVAA
jgi:signal transduction histidine kinase